MDNIELYSTLSLVVMLIITAIIVVTLLIRKKSINNTIYDLLFRIATNCVKAFVAMLLIGLVISIFQNIYNSSSIWNTVDNIMYFIPFIIYMILNIVDIIRAVIKYK
ncbi:MAG: hypothetical protein LBM02_07335 [Lachnospiraceae bacterium]|jgi:hypothetical protein|nr:hypothetical protein [Lachnospiraceae bacterium]